MLFYEGLSLDYLIIYTALTAFLNLIDEKWVPMAEAKDCHKAWNCKGEQPCWEDCKNRYNGKRDFVICTLDLPFLSNAFVPTSAR